MAHEARFVRTRSRRHPWRWLGMLVLGSAFLASGMLGASQAAEPWAVTVTGLTGSADDLSLDGLTYDDATTALEQAAADGTPVTLPVAPLAFAGLTSTGATLDTQASTRTLTVGGPVKLLGVDADILVVAAWDSATDDSPSVTVAFRQDDISLTDLAPSLDAVDVGLSSAWTAFRRDTTDSSDVVVDDLPAAGQAFFDDGDASTVDDLAVGSGVAFRGAVTPGTPGLGQALTRLGINSARLDGTLSTSTEALEEGAPAPTGFSLTATIGVTSPASMPEWLELGSPWSLGLATDGAGTLTATLTGGATLTLGDTAIPSTAEVSVTRAPGGALSVDLTLDVDEVEAPFGATWLTLNSASLTASISADSVSGSVEASVTVDKGGDDELAGRVAITLARSAGATSATVDADLTGSISAQDLATLVGADLDGLPDGAPDFSLSDLSLHVGVDGSTTPKEISVSATGTAQVDFGDSTLGARVLVSSGQGGLLIAARPSDEVLLSDLLGSTSPDPVLPDIAVVISDHDLEAAASDLDGPTRAYFAKALCDSADQDCDFDLTIDTGVGIEANIQLPDQLTDALGEIGLETEDALRVSGHIPAFGGTKTELVVQLPGLAAAGDGQYVRGAGLDLFIRKQGAAVTFGLDGHLTLGIPRLESDDCPSGLYVGSGNSRTCIDEVRFSLAAQISFDTTSTSFELVGGLASKSDQGWQQPFGIPYLTIHEAKLKLGVTTGGTSAGSVSLGFLGRMNIGDKDISISALAGVRAEAPWIDFKGFTGSSKSGVSLRDLAKLHAGGLRRRDRPVDHPAGRRPQPVPLRRRGGRRGPVPALRLLHVRGPLPRPRAHRQPGTDAGLPAAGRRRRRRHRDLRGRLRLPGLGAGRHPDRQGRRPAQHQRSRLRRRLERRAADLRSHPGEVQPQQGRCPGLHPGRGQAARPDRLRHGPEHHRDLGLGQREAGRVNPEALRPGQPRHRAAVGPRGDDDRRRQLQPGRPRLRARALPAGRVPRRHRGRDRRGHARRSTRPPTSSPACSPRRTWRRCSRRSARRSTS